MRNGPNRHFPFVIGCPSYSPMGAFSVFFASISSIARLISTESGSSVRGIEVNTSSYFTYGPNLPSPIMTSFPSCKPSIFGNEKSVSESSSAISSIDCHGERFAYLGFSSSPSSSAVPICTTGPNRLIRASTVRPVFGSFPRMRSPENLPSDPSALSIRA